MTFEQLFREYTYWRHKCEKLEDEVRILRTQRFHGLLVLSQLYNVQDKPPKTKIHREMWERAMKRASHILQDFRQEIKDIS